jgi:mannose-6-phosphate isomerase
VLLLNLIHLQPGDGLYLPAGELHAYLAGAGVELMANSNNVLRGGLTPKHIAVDELLEVVRFNPRAPDIQRPTEPDRAELPAVWPVPAEEFLLERYRLGAGATSSIDAGRLRLGIVTAGRIRLPGPARPSLDLGRGATFMIPAACTATLEAAEESEVHLARMP